MGIGWGHKRRRDLQPPVCDGTLLAASTEWSGLAGHDRTTIHFRQWDENGLVRKLPLVTAPQWRRARSTGQQLSRGSFRPIEDGSAVSEKIHLFYSTYTETPSVNALQILAR